MWSNNLQAKVTCSCSQLMIEIGKSVLQQSPNSEAADGCGRCRCGATKVLKCSWHGGVHPSFFGGCKLYTRFDQARHDRAIGVRGESFDTIISSPRYNSHLVLNELKAMLSHLEEAKSYYNTSCNLQKIR